MKNQIKTRIALTTACLGLSAITTFAAGAGLDVLIGNTGGDRIASLFDPQAGVLYVVGNDKDNTMQVSASRDGAILVNLGQVRIEGGTPTLKNLRLIVMHGGRGNDILVAHQLPAVVMFGGDGSDFLIWDNSDEQLDGKTDAADYILWRRTSGAQTAASSDQTTVIGGLLTTSETFELAKEVVGGWGNDWIVGGTGQDAPCDSMGYLLTAEEDIEWDGRIDF